ncbi:MAG: response regulator transcription factor [bacterium]
MKGRDLDGNLFCRPNCHVSRELARGNPVASYDLVVQGPDGKPIIVNIGTFSAPKQSGTKMDIMAFLVLRRIDSYAFLRRLKSQFSFQASALTPGRHLLTARELEVLELASGGIGTEGIAVNLSISPVTVRNHFKNIFSKLNVHSRSAAISLALRSNFF